MFRLLRVCVAFWPVVVAAAQAAATAPEKSSLDAACARAALLRGLDYLAFPSTYTVEHSVWSFEISRITAYAASLKAVTQSAATALPCLAAADDLLSGALSFAAENPPRFTVKYLVAHSPDLVSQKSITDPPLHTLSIAGYSAVLYPSGRRADIFEGGHPHETVAWDEQLQPLGCRSDTQSVPRFGTWSLLGRDSAGLDIFQIVFGEGGLAVLSCSEGSQGVRLPLLLAEFTRDAGGEHQLSTLARFTYDVVGPKRTVYLSHVKKLHVMGDGLVFLEVDRNTQWTRGLQRDAMPPYLEPGWIVNADLNGHSEGYVLKSGRAIPEPLRPFIFPESKK